MWLFYAILSGIFFTAEGLLSRHLLKGQKDAWAFSFYFSLIGAVVSFPFMLASPHFPVSWQFWSFVAFVGILIVAHNFFLFKAFNTVEASISGTIFKFRLVWVFMFGILIFNETITWEKVLGIILTLAAGVVVVHSFKSLPSFKGVVMVLVAAVLNAILVILIKYLLETASVGSVTFFAGFLAPALFNIVIMPQGFKRATKMIKENGKLVFLACGAGALANLAQNQALLIGEASRVVVLLEAFLILTLAGEHILLKERERAWVKIVSVLFATAGALFISI
jgi:drug/metabolite transporter (DMT)-like permease